MRSHQETNKEKSPLKKIEIELLFTLLPSLDGNQPKAGLNKGVNWMRDAIEKEFSMLYINSFLIETYGVFLYQNRV